MKKEKKDKKGTPSYILKDFDLSGHIANHYGFIAINSPKVTKLEETQSKNITKEKDPDLLERLALLNFYTNSHFINTGQPALFYTKKPFSGSGKKSKKDLCCGLEVIGSGKALAEAIVLKTAWSIIREYNKGEIVVDINCTGEKESFSKFEKELNNYIKKNIAEAPSELRTKLKKDPMALFSEKENEDLEFYHNAPKPLNFLSEQSREYFKEVLEFLESFEIPYRINHSLLGDKNSVSHIIFEIKDEKDKVLAYGSRYNYLAKKIGNKKDIYCFGANIFYDKKLATKKYHIEKIPKPKIYAIQLGNHAKLKLLNLIEMLRQEKIPVYHSLTKEKITGQLSSAEYLKVSHLLIMGQKEAIEGSVVVRSIDVRDQETVFLKELPDYIRKILGK